MFCEPLVIVQVFFHAIKPFLININQNFSTVSGPQIIVTRVY